MGKFIVNIDYPTRFENSGKKFVIFKNIIVDGFKFELLHWVFAPYTTNIDNGDVEVDVKKAMKFMQLQNAFFYADENNLMFF